MQQNTNSSDTGGVGAAGPENNDHLDHYNEALANQETDRMHQNGNGGSYVDQP